MDGGEIELSTFVNSLIPHEYKAWKEHRNKVIIQVGDKLLQIDELSISRTFDGWEKSIRDSISSNSPMQPMEFLLAVSVLHFFQRNINIIRPFSDHIYFLLESNDPEVFKTASEVLHIISRENVDGIQLLSKPVENAFVWVKTRDSNLHPNALRVFKKVKNVTELNIIERIASSFDSFYQIVIGGDLQMRRTAIGILKFVLHNISFPSYKIMIANYFHASMIALSNASSTPSCLHGVILVLRAFFEFQPILFNDERNKIMSSLVKITSRDDDDLVIDAFKFWLDIGRKSDLFFTNEFIQSMLDILFGKCRKSEMKEKYYKLLETTCSVFGESRLNITNVVQFLEDILLNKPQLQISCYAFKVLSSLISRDPDTKFSHNVFDRNIFPDDAIACLQLMAKVDDSILEYIRTIVSHGLNTTTDKTKTIQALKLVRVFEVEFFDTADSLFETLLPFTQIDDEKLHLEVIKTIALVDNEKSNEFLLNTALFDRYESSRKEALMRLPPSPDLSTNPLLSQILSDPGIDMKRMAINVIADVCQFNSFLMQDPIFSLVEDIFGCISSMNNLNRSVELASLLPVIANKLHDVIKPLTHAIIIGSISCICPDMPKIEHENNIFSDELTAFNFTQDPKEILKRDGYEFVSKTIPLDRTKNQLFMRLNQKNIDIRDGYLLQTLAEFAHDITPFLDYTLMVFYKIFTERTNHRLLTEAAESLAKITSGIRDGLNLRRYCPQFIPALTKVLTSTTSQKASIAILQLLGTSIDNFDSNAIQSTDIELQLSVDLCKDSYYTDFVLSHLSKYFDQPNDELLQAVTRIFEAAPQDAAKFVGKVISLFIRTIERTKVNNRIMLFSQLEQITASCPKECEQFLPDLTNCLLHHVSERGCMLLCSCLSYTFMSAFIPFSRLLFIAALGCVVHEENVAETLKFIAFSVCYQNQPLSMMLDCCEDLMRMKMSMINCRKIAKNLCIIVQSIDSSLHQARIARIIRTLYKIIPNDYFLTILAFSLAITCRMTKEIARNFIPDTIDATKLYDALDRGVFDIRATDFIEIIPIRFLPTQVEIPGQEETTSFFDERTVPSEIDMKTWLEDLCSYSIKCSPSDVIRSCYSFVERQVQFKRNLFPIAFLSCWEVASKESMNHFSEIVYQITKTHLHYNQTLLHLAEIADRALKPFNVPYLALGRISESKPLALYFLQKAHQKEPNNTHVVENLLALNNTMGRNKSAQGLLAQTSSWRDHASSARWNECLGEWQKALDLYDIAPQTLSSRIRCSAHLHKWDQIRDMENEFWQMSKTDQANNARHFGWAFYHTDELTKVAKILMTFSNEPSHSDIIFKAVVALRQNKLKEAQEFVDDGFRAIAKNRKYFNGGDNNRAAHNLAAAQLLIEISEAIKYKVTKQTNLSDVWTRRLKGFKRDGDTWIKLIQIRSLVAQADSDYAVYLKMLSVLRREQRWDIIDSYIDKLSIMKVAPPEIALARAKIAWSRGQREEAINTLEAVKDQEMNPSVSAHIYRKLASYINLARPDEMNQVAAYYKCARNKDINDPRSWIGWAYACNAIAQKEREVEKERERSPVEETSDTFGLRSVYAFNRAVTLCRTGNLEYLILMFATFFKVKESKRIAQDLIDEMLTLPHSMVAQVIPQIAVQITHKDALIRNIVHKILIKFGNEHFQAIMFPLGMYRVGNEPDEKYMAADEILNKLQKKHKEEARDAKIFVQGMLDAALTPFERWVIALDEAAQAQREGNQQKLNQLLSKMFRPETYKKTSDLDKRFYKLHGQTIAQAAELFNQRTEQSITQMWDILKKLYQSFLDKTNKLEIILLPRVNEDLYTKRDFAIAIPGTYSVTEKSHKIKCVEPGLQVLGTQQHPRICFLNSDAGERVKFLLKGSEDLRLDQRVMQFFNLVNSLLHHDTIMRDHPNAAIVEYAIIPLAPSAGLIRWVENADTLHQMICDMRDANKSSQVPEFEVLNKCSGGLFQPLMTIQRLEAFGEITKVCPAYEVRDFLWYRASNAQKWLIMQDNFTLTTALMSMIGYVIGLGDRHPSNIMVQRDTGRVIHIDFGDTFETTINRASYPEKVPFRLTRMIVNALDGGNVEGMFTELCTSTMHVLRQNKSSLVALLEIFIHEPLEESLNERNGHLPPTQSIARVSHKLAGTDMMNEFNRALDVAEQVKVLIRDASDITKYVSHYAGWCPYW